METTPDLNPDLLRRAREEAQLSQRDLAANLDISQAQVSHYEKKPGSIPAKLLFQWLKTLGLGPFGGLPDLFRESNEDALKLTPGHPYEELRKDLQLLERYIDVGAPDYVSGDQSSDSPPNALPADLRSTSTLKKHIRRLRQKPIVMMAGGFDTGKSYLANTLMGREILPHSYQPATRVVTVVRHVDDRPEWQNEDVWLFNSDIWTVKKDSEDDSSTEEDSSLGESDPPMEMNISVFDNEDQCDKARILAGSHDLMRQYAVHRNNVTEAVQEKMKQAHTAVVYADAPLLHSCTLVDLPGFGDRPHDGSSYGSTDQEKAIAALPYADIILYASRIVGHLDGQDLLRISSLLGILRAPEADHKDFPTLGNFFIIGTHADRSISDDHLKTKVAESALNRLHSYLSTSVLQDREEYTNREITAEDLRKQWFPFWAENVERSQPLVEHLSYVLGEAFPRVHESDVDERVQSIKREAVRRLDQTIASYQSIARKRDTKKEILETLQERKANKDEDIRHDKEAILQQIDALKQQTEANVNDVVDQMLKEDAIKKYIDKTFDSDLFDGEKGAQQPRKEAKTRLPTLFIRKMLSEVEKALSTHTGTLLERVEHYLDRFNQLASMDSKDKENIKMPFDAREAFARGRMNVSNTDGLSTQTSPLSLLGEYLPAINKTRKAEGQTDLSDENAKLREMMVGAAGAAGAAGAVAGFFPLISFAAFSFPLTLAIGAATGFTSWRLLASSWEGRLARKLVSHLESKDIRYQLVQATNVYWDQIREAFKAGAENVDNEFEKQIEQLKNEITEEDARSKIEDYKAVRDFYAGLPW